MATLLGSQAQIVCTDPFREYQDNDIPGAIEAAEIQFHKNIAASAMGHRTNHHKCVLAELDDGFFHIIYVDGSHLADDVWSDAIEADKRLKSGGMLIFDDYGWTINPNPKQRPKPAIDRFIAENKDRYELIEMDFRVFLRKL